MQISQTISSKYADKINKGDIELDKLMDSIKKKVPGMESIIDNLGNMKSSEKKNKEKIIIDENYSTSKVNLGENTDEKLSNFNIGKILKSADAMGVIPGGSKNTNNPEMGKLGDMFKMLNSNTANGGIPSMDNMMKMMQTPEMKKMMQNLDINQLLNPKK